MSPSAAPCESSSHIKTPELTKGKETIHCRRVSSSHAGLAVLPLFSRLSRKLHDPKLSPISACEMLSTNTPEAETYVRILSAFPKPNKCVPDSYLNNKGGIGRIWRAASFPTNDPRPMPLPGARILPGYLFRVSRDQLESKKNASCSWVTRAATITPYDLVKALEARSNTPANLNLHTKVLSYASKYWKALARNDGIFYKDTLGYYLPTIIHTAKQERQYI